MSLLSEIQNAAIDADVDISVVLRKCKVLAARLGNEEFRLWVERELNGYPSEENLPAYRVLLGLESYGDFVGMFGAQLKNAPIPSSCIPEQYRESVTTMYLREPIIYYSSLMKNSRDEDANFSAPWPADLIAAFGATIYRSSNCITASRCIPCGTIAALLDTIRNRILSFVLQIEAEAPDAGEPQPKGNKIPEERISQVFNMYIQGNVANLAAGSQPIITTTQITVVENDFESLRKYLVSLGIGQQDIDELNKAINKDAKPNEKGGIGDNVGAWIGKMISKASSDAWKITTTIAANVLTKVILRYYGLE